jgi:hypothetical protein
LYSLKATVTSAGLYTLPINRGFRRLSTIYWTLWDGTGKETSRFFSPLNQEVEGTLVAVNDQTDLMEWSIQVGSDRYPQFDCASHAESYSRLRNAQLIHQGSDSFSISSNQYRSTKAIYAMNLEKCPGASSHSGINTRSGSQLSLNFKNLGAATQIHVVMHFEAVVTCSAAGCEILD